MSRKTKRTGFDVRDVLARISYDDAQRWLFGIAVAAPAGLYGLICIITQHAYMPAGRRSGFTHIAEHHGSRAIEDGLLLLVAALLLHFYYFWREHSKVEPYADLIKGIGLVALIGMCVFAAYRALSHI